MKNKTSLLLMEQLVMVLVFALAAALCLTVFVKADQISRETVRRDEAVLLEAGAKYICRSGAELPAAIRRIAGEM